MSWQEDLHRLEHDLAMGRLSAEDYRRQRDELLAAANAGQAFQNPPPNQGGQPTGTPPGGVPASGFPPAGTPSGGFPPPGTPSGGFPAANPGFPPGTPPGGFPGNNPTGTPPGGVPGQQQPGQQQAPFPPAFKWAAQPPSSESTQTIRPVGSEQPPASSDATQVVHNNPAMDRTQAVTGRPGDADRTQVVHNNPFGQPQQGGQAPWRGADQSGLYSSGQMDSMPNWNTGGAFGDWPKQGPEVFDSSGSGKGGKRVLLIVLVVVVVAGLGVGSWLLFGHKSAPQAGAGTQTNTSHAATPTTTPPPRPAIDNLVNAPGNPTSQAFTAEQLKTLKPLPQSDLDILGNTSLSKADYVVSRDGTTVLDLWSFTVQDSTAAAALAKKFDTDQGRFHFEASDITTTDGQYTAEMSPQQQSDGKNVVAYRLHYVVGNEVIRVEAFDPSATKARSEFLKLLRLQTQLTPPSR